MVLEWLLGDVCLFVIGHMVSLHHSYLVVSTSNVSYTALETRVLYILRRHNLLSEVYTIFRRQMPLSCRVLPTACQRSLQLSLLFTRCL